MKKISLLIVFCCICTGVICGSEKQRLLKIASGNEFIPMVFLDENQNPDGMHVDMWKSMGKKGGFTPEFILDEWHECIPALLNGEVDAVHGVSYTENRAKILDYSKVIDSFNVYVYFNEEKVAYREVEDLNDLNVGVQKGHNKVIDFIHEHAPQATVIEFPTIFEMLNAAEAFKIHLIAFEERALLWTVSKNHKTFNFRRSHRPLFKDEVHAVVRKGDQVTLDLINAGIDTISPAERAHIQEEWLGTSIYDPLPVQKIKITVYISLTLVILLLSAAVISLRLKGRTLKRLLNEKQAMFRDLQHHIRNNLAVMLGFIEMKKVSKDQQELIALLDNIGNKMYAIATVHNQISKNDNIWKVDIRTLLEDLINNIQDVFKQPDVQIKLDINTRKTLPLTQAVPFSLLVNEIVNNAYVYAFADNASGEIDISISQVHANLVLTISDNGPGIDEAVLEAKGSTGIALTKMLAQQIGGELKITSDQGSLFELVFKPEPITDPVSVSAALE